MSLGCVGINVYQFDRPAEIKNDRPPNIARVFVGLVLRRVWGGLCPSESVCYLQSYISARSCVLCECRGQQCEVCGLATGQVAGYEGALGGGGRVSGDVGHWTVWIGRLVRWASSSLFRYIFGRWIDWRMRTAGGCMFVSVCCGCCLLLRLGVWGGGWLDW